MILILTQCYPSRIGGIESLVSNLSLELAKTEKIIVFRSVMQSLHLVKI